MNTKSKSIQDNCGRHCPLPGCTCRDCIKCLEQSTPNSPEEQDIPMPPKRITNVKLRITSIRKGQPKTEVRESATNPHKSYKDVRTEDTWD